jgi:ADP-ribosylglycohydrolase
MPIPIDYEERVYAGVLGKIIGVYLGRPFEGWSYERIMERLGEVNYYVHERLNAPLIVTDDDISGTFTFLRALPDYGNPRDLPPRAIGQTWLNYIIENRAILWWGGMGNSTEHTAYMRLKRGIPAPESGAIATNGKTVAEQIGAQIFIDGWAMVAPGDPELAADLARRAASVSHDGEAIYGAQVIAAMEAQAFVERDLNCLLDTATALIPRDSTIYRLITDMREWRAADNDWRRTRERVAERYGYDKFIGNCHMVPNHAVILLGLLYGDDDFQRSLMITNTAGWDTDCNSGNVGCLMGIKNGLAGIDAGPDWRGPVADRMYLPTADGGRAVTDAVRETYRVAAIGRALAGETNDPRPTTNALAPRAISPKEGARFHFSLPGSVQGFMPEESPECRGTATVTNVAGAGNERSLAIQYRGVTTGRSARVATATFTPPEALRMRGYSLLASPSLYPGQTIRAQVIADDANTAPIQFCLYVRVYNAEESLTVHRSPAQTLDVIPTPLPAPGRGRGRGYPLTWTAPDTGGSPIAEVGVEIASDTRADGTLYLDWLTWDGAPDVLLGRPEAGGDVWHRAWVNAADHAHFGGAARPYRVMQDEGVGLLIQGEREWRDYTVSAAVTPALAASAGIAACVQGQKRYLALLLCRDGKARLVKALDGLTTLAEADFAWEYDRPYTLSLRTNGSQIEGRVDDALTLTAEDRDRPLQSGAVALVVEEGRIDCGPVRVAPTS